MSSLKAIKVRHVYRKDHDCVVLYRHCIVGSDRMSSLPSGEADIVELHIKALIEAGLKAKDIAVIAPYNLQVSHKIHLSSVATTVLCCKCTVMTVK